MRGDNMNNLELMVSILVGGFTTILTAVGVVIGKIYKSKAEYIKAQNEGNQQLLNELKESKQELKELKEDSKTNKKRIEKLNQAFGLYVANNGVPQKVKDEVYQILNGE